jgi:hypothetical protein
MKNLTKYQQIGLGAVAVVAIFFAWKQFSKSPEVIVVEEVATKVED